MAAISIALAASMFGGFASLVNVAGAEKVKCSRGVVVILPDKQPARRHSEDKLENVHHPQDHATSKQAGEWTNPSGNVTHDPLLHKNKFLQQATGTAIVR
jgi:hypothetical protein